MVDRKLWRENRKENFFGMCLVGWGGKKINCRAQVFSPWAHQNVFSPKWRENWVRMNFFLMDKNAYVHIPLFIYLFFSPWVVSNVAFLFLFFVFFFWFSRAGCDSCFFFFKDVIFIFGCDFYFFNKFGWLLFFGGYLSLFCFNWFAVELKSDPRLTNLVPFKPG